MMGGALIRFVLLLPGRLQRRGWERPATWLDRLLRGLRPHHPEVLRQSGRLALDQGRMSQGIALLRRALVAGGHAAYLFDELGRAGLRIGLYEMAADQFRQAIGRDPARHVSWINLAHALTALGEERAAETCLERALTVRPDSVIALHGLGGLYQRTNRAEAAAALFRRAVELQPGFMPARVALVGACIDLGRFEEAGKLLDAGGEARDRAVSALYQADLHGDRADAPLSELEQRLTEARLSEHEKNLFHFSLGRGYLARGDAERGMAYLHRGNRAWRERFHYELAEDAAFMQRIAAVFDRDFFAAAADGGGCPSEVPVFILGMPRSGTTLVEQILASHSQVHGGGELPDIGALACGLGELDGERRGFPEAARAVPPAAWRDLGQAYGTGLRLRGPGARRVTDKMPHNFLYIGLIHRLLPRARIILCRRDPVDVCLSCYMQRFDKPHNYAYDLADLGGYYRLYDRLMAHWRQVLPGRWLEVRYEALVAAPEVETRRLLDWCGLSWEAGCLAFHRNPRPVHTASVMQVRQPIYRDAVRRWKRLEGHLGPLLEALGPLVEAYGNQSEHQSE